jgi:toxin ParE1/3/4
LNVNFTPQARDDLASIRDWIAEDDERAADRVVARIVQTAMMFGQFPLLGRAGLVENTREFSVVGLPYLIVYRIGSDTDVNVLTIIHTRRKYPA